MPPLPLQRFRSVLDYIKSQGLEEKQENITHIAWATGGRLVPEDVKEEYVHTHLA